MRKLIETVERFGRPSRLLIGSVAVLTGFLMMVFEAPFILSLSFMITGVTILTIELGSQSYI